MIVFFFFNIQAKNITLFCQYQTSGQEGWIEKLLLYHLKKSKKKKK